MEKVPFTINGLENLKNEFNNLKKIQRPEIIKAISIAAREELESFIGRRVHLFCQIKVREKWLNEAERYAEMGLDYNDGN